MNGYAIYGSGLKGGKIFDNRISSVGRTIHLTAADIEYYGNRATTKGHMTLSDRPQGSGIWLERRVELHGIKFEGTGAKNIKVYDNFMEITKPQPDGEWDYVPATPLNIASYDPNAMNEVYNNKVISHTTYRATRHGPYGDSGEWASSIYFVGMTNVSDQGLYSVYIHDNEFISNDLFISGDIRETHIVRIEDNIFRLGPEPTNEYAIFRSVPPAMQDRVLNGNNTFIMGDTTSGVENQFDVSGITKIQIFPNPFAQSTIINYELSMPSSVILKVYDALGIEVAVIVDEFQPAGTHSCLFNAGNHWQGMYSYTIQIGGRVESGKMMLVR